MKIIETIKKDPTLTTKEVITIKRVPLKGFPLFTQVDSSPEIVIRYLEASKSDGMIPYVNILDLRQQPLEVSTRKSIKRKATGEGTSQKTPKAAKKKCNSSFVSVIESLFLSTSETLSSLKPTEDPSPQTLDDFDL